jgi:hypothetical protein
MNELFTALGAALASICGGDFEEATVHADLFDTHTKTEYSCKRRGGRVVSVESEVSDNFAVYNALKDIKEGMGNSWTRCVFTLRVGSKFTFETELVDNPLEGDDPESAF